MLINIMRSMPRLHNGQQVHRKCKHVTCKLHISQEFFKDERTTLNIVFSVTNFICLAQC